MIACEFAEHKEVVVVIDPPPDLNTVWIGKLSTSRDSPSWSCRYRFLYSSPQPYVGFIQLIPAEINGTTVSRNRASFVFPLITATS